MHIQSQGFFLTAQKGSDHSKKGSQGCKVSFLKKKYYFEIISPYFTSVGVYFIHFFYFCSSDQKVKTLKSNTDVKRIKNKVIKICHLKESSYKSKKNTI